MFFAVVDRRTPRIAAVLASALAIAACGTGTSAVANDESAAVAGNDAAEVTSAPVAGPAPSAQARASEGVEPPSATLAALGEIEPGTETPGTEISDAQAYGQWKVIDAAGPASGQAMIGRTLTFTEDELGWQDAGGKVEATCPNHMYHIAQMAAEVKKAAPIFRPGWARFRLPPSDVGPMHVWECGDAESVFGPVETGGAAFFPVGKDRLVMNWNNGAVLLLRKERGGA